MLLHKFDFDYNAKDLQDLIRGFSVQILHQPILFSTASLHNINYALLTSVSSAFQILSSKGA